MLSISVDRVRLPLVRSEKRFEFCTSRTRSARVVVRRFIGAYGILQGPNRSVSFPSSLMTGSISDGGVYVVCARWPPAPASRVVTRVRKPDPGTRGVCGVGPGRVPGYTGITDMLWPRGAWQVARGINNGGACDLPQLI